MEEDKKQVDFVAGNPKETGLQQPQIAGAARDDDYVEAPLGPFQEDTAPTAPPPTSTTAATLDQQQQQIIETTEAAVNEANENEEQQDASSSNNMNLYPPPGILTGAVANLCSATLGAGILAVPYSMAAAGVVASAGLLTVAAAATLVSIQFLSTAVTTYRYPTYEQLTSHLFGPTARTAVEFCIVLFCQGVAVAYLIAVADILEQANLLVAHSRALTMTTVWAFVCLPLSLLRRMQTLQTASVIGIASIATLLFAAVVHLVQDLDEEYHPSDNGNQTNGTWSSNENNNDLNFDSLHVFDIANTTNNTTRGFHVYDWHELWWPLNGWKSILQACPVILFAFSCQVNVCAILLELPAPNEGNNNGDDDSQNPLTLYHPAKVALMRRVAGRAVAVCTILYAGMGLTTLADFGVHAIQPNILQNYNLRQGIFQVAAASMAVAVLVAFPLNIFPSRVTCRAWGKPIPALTTNTTSNGGVANPDLTVALLQDYQETQAEQQQNQIESSQTNGENHGGIMVHENSDHNDDTQQLLPEDDPIPTRQRRQTTMSTEGFENEYNNEDEVDGDDDSDESNLLPMDWVYHILWTLFLSGSALALALVVPDISIVFSVLGGTTSSWLGFCVPGLLGLRLEQDSLRPSWIRWTLAWLLLLGGLGVGLLTTILTIMSL